MSETIVYTKNFCPYCDMAKQLLEEKGIAFTEININNAANPADVLSSIQKITNRKTFPQIVLQGLYIGGYTDLRDYFYQK
jgi:glutaredoxin 3